MEQNGYKNIIEELKFDIFKIHKSKLRQEHNSEPKLTYSKIEEPDL